MAKKEEGEEREDEGEGEEERERGGRGRERDGLRWSVGTDGGREGESVGDLTDSPEAFERATSQREGSEGQPRAAKDGRFKIGVRPCFNFNF